MAPRKQNRGRSNKPQRNRGNKANPPATSLSYRGPGFSRGQLPLAVVPLTWTITFQSTALGNLNVSIDTDPRSAGEWSLPAGLYQDFRVLALNIRYCPFQHYYQTTTPVNAAPLIWWPLHAATNSSSPATFDAASQISGCRLKSSDTPHSMTIRMNGSDESQWIDITSAAPAGVWGRIGVTSGTGALTPSVNIGLVIVTLMVQFRGRV